MKFGRGFLVLSLLLFFHSSSHALPERESRFLVGHNLDPTPAVLNEGEASIGTYAISYGLTDFLTLSTSPWIDINYNMAMSDLKFGLPTPGLGPLKRFSIEGIYFKTFPFLLNWYTQTSTMDRITGTFAFASIPNYFLHVTLNYQHFWIYSDPFSLRMLPSSKSDSCHYQSGYCGPTDTWSFGLLHQIDFNDHWGMFLETGILGFNYVNPYTHLGLSAFYITRGLLVQLGLSWSRSTAAVHAAFMAPSLADPNKLSGGSDDKGMFQLVHPEIQLQFPL